MNTQLTHIHVVVPARNEEGLIDRCLSMIARCRDELVSKRAPMAVSVTVVLDRCDDGTAAIAHRHGARLVECDAGTVGGARHLGVTAALGSVGDSELANHWIANTDADSAVPHDWLIAHAELASAGADLVAGLVTPDEAPLTPHQRTRWHLAHPVESGHSQIYGANLGIRGDIYRAIGGFEPLATGEDRALVAAAGVLGAITVATARGIVSTSARRYSRAPNGFAEWVHSASR
ncbi:MULTISPECIES: glycosyltransferase [Gordonia]|jgi:glycosyltransferase involved in cell wall biosynthesis|uniref:glycosyltransferase n=1 Tax=Gordonia TaxID=2053 RepID=UPI0032B4751F